VFVPEPAGPDEPAEPERAEDEPEPLLAFLRKIKADLPKLTPEEFAEWASVSWRERAIWKRPSAADREARQEAWRARFERMFPPPPKAIWLEPKPLSLPPREVVVVGDDSHAVRRRGDKRTPARIPTKLAEQACQLRERQGYGRRKLSEAIPGLTPYQAEQILKWYRVGEPAGLWLDRQGRLKWSRAISTTRDGIRLPRI
jgi:hypothetical protein